MPVRREIARNHLIVHALIKKPGLVDRRHYTLYILGDEGTVAVRHATDVGSILGAWLSWAFGHLEDRCATT